MRKDAEKNNNNNNFEEIMAIKAKAKTTLKQMKRSYNMFFRRQKQWLLRPRKQLHTRQRSQPHKH